MKSASKNWEKVKKDIEDFLEYTLYNTWFRDLTFHKYDKSAETLFLITSNKVSKSQLESRFKQLIIEKSNEVYGDVSNVAILLKSEVDLKPTTKVVRVEPSYFDDENLMDPKFTFDSFVVGENNNLAYSCAFTVAKNAEKPEQSHNPLFIYGGSGIGKTHLMCAIGHYIYENFPHLVVRYVSSELFTNDYVNATAPGKDRLEQMQLFKEKYRNIDILMIDDIEFIESKEKTKEEVFWTFNELFKHGKQLVFTSDKPPKDLHLDDKLKSRLMSGMRVGITPPEFNVKVEILVNKAILDNIPLSEGMNEVIALIAAKTKSNVREMQGTFNSIVAYSAISGKPVNKQMAQKVFSDMFSDTDIIPTPEKIKKVVAKHYNISISDLESSKKSRSFSFPRQVAMYLCKELTDLGLQSIADAFNRKDHSTVIYAHGKIKKEIIEDGNLNAIINELEDKIINN